MHGVRDTSGICSRCRVVICPSGGFLTGVSTPPLQKYFASPVGQIISTTSRHPTPQEGRWPSSRTRGGMRWTRQRFARDGIAGRVGERPVSGQQHADERCCSVRRSRVVLTPRRWCQVRGVNPTCAESRVGFRQINALVEKLALHFLQSCCGPRLFPRESHLMNENHARFQTSMTKVGTTFQNRLQALSNCLI